MTGTALRTGLSFLETAVLVRAFYSVEQLTRWRQECWGGGKELLVWEQHRQRMKVGEVWHLDTGENSSAADR